MISATNVDHLCAAGALLLGCLTLYLCLIEANKCTILVETEQTKRDAALSVEAQVERERSSLLLEQERFKHEKFVLCIKTLQKLKLRQVKISTPTLAQMGCIPE